MKKFVLVLALAGFVSAGAVSPALACKGGKCSMTHTDKSGKKAKGKKDAAKGESCHTVQTSGTTAASSAAPEKSCCAKKGTAKTEAAKEVKAQR